MDAYIELIERLVTNAFRLLVRSGLANVPGTDYALLTLESQTPFGCWSDQDTARRSTSSKTLI